MVLDLLGVPVKLCLATFPECRCEFWGISEMFRSISMILVEGNCHFQSLCIPAVTLICRICSKALETVYFTVLFSIMGSKCHCCRSLQFRLIVLWSDFSSRGKWTRWPLALRLKSSSVSPLLLLTALVLRLLPNVAAVPKTLLSCFQWNLRSRTSSTRPPQRWRSRSR